MPDEYRGHVRCTSAPHGHNVRRIQRVKKIVEMRFFNTAGPVNAEQHDCLPSPERFNLDDVLMLIQQHKYFMLHAPRQTGTTSALLSLMDYLNDQDQYRCVYVNVEVGQSARESVAAAMQAIVGGLASPARRTLNDPSQARQSVVGLACLAARCKRPQSPTRVTELSIRLS